MDKKEMKMIALTTLLKRAIEHIAPVNKDIYAVHIDLVKSTKEHLVYFRFPVIGAIKDDRDNFKYVSHGPDGPRVIDADNNDTFIGYFTEEDYLGEIMQDHGRMMYKKFCEK